MPFIADPEEREIEVLRGLMAFRDKDVLDISMAIRDSDPISVGLEGVRRQA